jgi:hypothetical protein
VGASTSRNPKGLHGLYRDNFTLPYLKAKDILDPVKIFIYWERFQSSASVLIFLRIEINSCIEADKASLDFADSITSAYKLSAETTTI